MNNNSIQNNYYDIRYDESKNRYYLKVKGYWENIEKAKQYWRDWYNIRASAKHGFTVLADLREMKAPTPDIAEFHARIQKMLLENGLIKVAEVIDSPITKISVDNMANDSGMKQFKQVFENYDQAEQWLDSCSR